MPIAATRERRPQMEVSAFGRSNGLVSTGQGHTPVNGGLVAETAPHPVAELLACPPQVAALLHRAASSRDLEPGETLFRQSEPARGLYLLLSGQFQRRAERLGSRLLLGSSHAGELVELAAILGDGRHTCTMSAISTASALFLPRQALDEAFKAWPPLRMQLLRELAREVSRAYGPSWRARQLRHGPHLPKSIL